MVCGGGAAATAGDRRDMLAIGVGAAGTDGDAGITPIVFCPGVVVTVGGRDAVVEDAAGEEPADEIPFAGADIVTVVDGTGDAVGTTMGGADAFGCPAGAGAMEMDVTVLVAGGAVDKIGFATVVAGTVVAGFAELRGAAAGWSA